MADLIVIGAGHAGCEAALAAARMGIDTLLLTLNMDGVALMACNPVIGGSAKGHLVRELDALGGEMGLAIDDTFLQSRMLNTGKGPAVHSLRAQADKQAYQNRMRKALMTCAHLTVRQGEAVSIETENNTVTAVTTATDGTAIDPSLVTYLIYDTDGQVLYEVPSDTTCTFRVTEPDAPQVMVRYYVGARYGTRYTYTTAYTPYLC